MSKFKLQVASVKTPFQGGRTNFHPECDHSLSGKLQGLLIFIVICILNFGFFNEVSAQQNTELTVAPPVAYVKIKPGGVTRHTVTVENTGTIDLQITPKLVDFKPSENTGTPLLSESLSFPYLDDESKQFQPIVLEAGKKAQLTLNITVPQFAPEKEYPMTILFSTQPLTQAQDTLTAVQGTIGSNLIVLISQQESLSQEFSVKDFDVGKFVDSFTSLSIQPVIKNERFNASTASGSATLKNWQGKTVAEYTIYPDTILGLSERPLRFSKSSDLQNIELLSPMPFAPDIFLLGPYTLTLAFTSSTDIPYAAQFHYSFIAIPYIILAAVILLLIGLAIYYWYRTKYIKQF